MTRPLIGVSTSRRGGWRSYLMHRWALYRVGARSVRLIAGKPMPAEPLQGLIIGGGDDIGAEIYGGTVLPDVRIDPERDKLELKLLDTALPRGLPVLGICRGSQMINVHRGGSLHADIHAVYLEAPRMRTPLPRKLVEIEPGSRLGAVLGLERCRVNALHHQSVDRLGRGLRRVARDGAGIVQGIEAPDADFLLGVQWHPEFLLLDRHQQNLFRALVAAARLKATGEDRDAGARHETRPAAARPS
jgi:putative glutamine amidotransferase